MKDILQQIQQLKEDFMNLKEVDDVGLGQPASDTPPSTNKIKRNVKTKNGKAELVSVEDELFPYDGNKREQYRQKIIDTVNGMIQGTATLDDLLQVVRSQKNMKPVKEELSEGRKPGESKEDFKHRLHGELVRAIDNKADRAKQDLIAGKKGAYDKYKKEHDKLDKLDDIEPVVNAYANESWKKAKEALEQLLGESKAKDPKGYQENIDIANHYDKLYSKEPAKAPDGSPNSVAAEWKRRYQEYFDKAMKCYYGDDKKEPSKISEECNKGSRKIYLRKLANALDAADMLGSENVPDGDMEELHKAEKEYKKDKLEEALNTLHELFDRPSLLDDITGQPHTMRKWLNKGANAIGKGITKAVMGTQRAVNPPMNFDKNEEKEYNECKALQLWEQVINEIEDNFFRKVLKKSEEEQENAEKMKDLATTKKSKDAIDDILIPRRHKHEVVNSKFEDKVVKRAEDEYRNSKKEKGN